MKKVKEKIIKENLYDEKGELVVMLGLGRIRAKVRIDKSIDLDSPEYVYFLLKMISEQVMEEWFKNKHKYYKGMKDSSDKFMLWKIPKEGPDTFDKVKNKKLLKK